MLSLALPSAVALRIFQWSFAAIALAPTAAWCQSEGQVIPAKALASLTSVPVGPSLLAKAKPAPKGAKAPAGAASVPQAPSAQAEPVQAALVPGIRGVDPQLAATMARCAPTVHPETMSAIVSAESRGHQFAIADAGPVDLPWSKRKAMVRSLYPGTLEEAVATAQQLIKKGHTVSLGVAQVNDRNLARMGVTINEVFDLCTNLAVGGRILTDFYTRAAARFGAGEKALHAALSAYNSGDWVRGEKDGYVSLVYRQLGRPLAVRTDRAGVSTSRVALAIEPASERPTRQFTMKVTDYSAVSAN